MERRSRKRSSSVGNEKMERVGDRYGQDGGTLFDRLNFTAGCSADGRRRKSVGSANYQHQRQSLTRDENIYSTVIRLVHCQLPPAVSLCLVFR